MYAIIRAGGHQEKVTVGEVITVDHLKQEPDTIVTYVPLLVSFDDEVVSDRKELEDTALVTGRILEHARGDKIDVFQYRHKTGFRRHIGHRSMLTLVEISEIKLGSKTMTLDDAKVASDQAATDKEEARKAAVQAREDAKSARAQKKAKDRASAAKKAPAKKAAAQKAPAKKTGAKKTAAKKSSPKK